MLVEVPEEEEVWGEGVIYSVLVMYACTYACMHGDNVPGKP